MPHTPIESYNQNSKPLLLSSVIFKANLPFIQHQVFGLTKFLLNQTFTLFLGAKQGVKTCSELSSAVLQDTEIAII